MTPRTQNDALRNPTREEEWEGTDLKLETGPEETDLF